MSSSVDNFFDRGVAKVKNVVSETSIEQRSFVKAFVQMCGDAAALGWHEANSGNLSYRMKPDEVSATRGYFNEVVGPWVALGVQADSLRDEVFLVTGAGCQFRMIPRDPSGQVGIIEINSAGDSYRVVWGLKQTGLVTSEFASHFIGHAVRKVVTAGADRVLYHAHPTYVAALTLAQQFDDHAFTRLLWKSLPESILSFPEGIGVVGWHVPSTKELAVATGEKAESFKAIVWQQHGVLCTGSDFAVALGYMQAIEKSAQVCCLARAIKGDQNFNGTLTDAQIQEMATKLNLPLNTAFLDL